MTDLGKLISPGAPVSNIYYDEKSTHIGKAVDDVITNNRFTQTEAALKQVELNSAHATAHAQQVEANSLRAIAQAQLAESNAAQALSHAKQVESINKQEMLQKEFKLNILESRINDLERINDVNLRELENTRIELSDLKKFNYLHWQLSDERQKHIDLIKHSFSWRLTFPLRFVGGYFLKIIKIIKSF
jgi:hypothetical protein